MTLVAERTLLQFARRIPTNLEYRPHSIAASQLKRLHEMISDLTAVTVSPELPKTPPWTAVQLELHELTAHLSCKDSCSNTAAGSLVESHLNEH